MFGVDNEDDDNLDYNFEYRNHSDEYYEVTDQGGLSQEEYDEMADNEDDRDGEYYEYEYGFVSDRNDSDFINYDDFNELEF